MILPFKKIGDDNTLPNRGIPQKIADPRWHLRGPEWLQFWSPDPCLRGYHLCSAEEGHESVGLRDRPGGRPQQGALLRGVVGRKKQLEGGEIGGFFASKTGDFTDFTGLEGLKLEKW